MKLTSLVWLLALAVTLVNSENPNPFAKTNDGFLNYRLPNETYPEHYDIQIATNVHTGGKTFEGKVIIDIGIAKATNNIVLHARQLNISKVSIASESYELVELSSEYEAEREFLTLKRIDDKEFATDTKWKLSISYKGELSDDKEGFGLYKYSEDEGEDHYLAATYFVRTYARQVFPCYDEPARRANFTITVNHSPTYTAISNMPLNENLSRPGKTVFLTTARIPTYIVALVVSDFKYTEEISNGISHRVYSRPSLKHKHELAISYAKSILNYISKYTGVKFMLPKLDHVAIPDYHAVGMENWGLITYSENSLLYNNNTTAEQRIINPLFMSQRISYQYFGDYVTIQWWTYEWLKRGLSSLFSFKALDNEYPERDLWQIYHINWYQRALTEDGNNSTEPLSFHVENPIDLDTSSGYKATCVLLMWNNALTEKIFQKAIQNFLKDNQYSAVDEQQFFTAIENAANEANVRLPAKIGEMMSTWTHQSGYPLLTITRNYEEGTFNIKQEAFHINETIKEAKTWNVPFNYAKASNPDFRNTTATHYLLDATEIKVDAGIAKIDWLVVNKQSTGFYRVKYDKENYNLITECLLKEPHKIHFRNRAQLLDDAYHLTISNRLDHSILLKMLTYLKKEDQYAAWTIANDIMLHYMPYLREFVDFKYFIADLVSPMFKKLGVEEISGENNYDKIMRDFVIQMACLAGVKECLVDTNTKVKALIKANVLIEPIIRNTILCEGLKEAGDEEYRFFYQKRLNARDYYYKIHFNSILGCSRNTNQLMTLLNSTIDGANALQTQDRISILFWVYSRSDIGLFACIDFLNDNYEAYAKLKRNSSGSNNPLDADIRSMAKYVVNENGHEKLMALIGKVKDSKYISRTLKVDVEKTIGENFKWFKKHGELIMSWISQYRAAHENGNRTSAKTAI